MGCLPVRFICLVAVLASYLVAAPSFALEPKRNLIEFNLQTWQTQHGLPHNMVQAIAQTPDGYLWFATWEGLARFNGFEFTVFDPYNTPELRDRGIRALLVSRDGALWLGTSRGGVTRYKQGVWTTFTQADGLAGKGILSLAEDSAGRIWVGTEADGVSFIEGTQISSLGLEHGLNDKTILAMGERVPGEMWLTTRNGVVCIEGATVTAFGPESGLPNGSILSVWTGTGGELMVGTQSGIFQWHEGGFVPHGGWAQFGKGQVSELMKDTDGVLWAGTFSDGFFRVSADMVEGLKTRNGLPNNRITAIFEDREGNIWIGTSGGLARLTSAPFSVLGMRNGLSDNYVRAILEDRSGGLWIGTSNGLNHISGTHSEVLTSEDGLGTNSVLSLMQASDGNVWVGTYGAGISILEDNRVKRVIEGPQALASNHVRSMVETHDGAIWVATIAGLTRFEDGVPTLTLDDSNGLPRSYVQALFVDHDGTLWVGTLQGLARIRETRVESLNGTLDGYDGSDVFGIHRDGSGNLWMATESGLLHVSDDDVARPINRLHGLPHDVLFGVTSDNLGYLWMSSNAGVFRARIDDLMSLVDGTNLSVHVDRYTEDQGLSSRQANGGSQPSLMRASTGRLWFATAAGAAVIDPQILANESDRKVPPSIVIEAVLVDGVPRDLGQPLRIAPGARHFEFRYAGLSFRAPENIRYQFQLQGFEAPVLAGGERDAHYTNLDPGIYTFQVWAAHPSAAWTDPARIEIQVDPNFWETRTFVAAVALFLVLAIWAGLRLRTANLSRRALELGIEVASRTRDLKQQTRRLAQANSEKSRLLTKLEEQSRAFEQQARVDALTGLANRRWFDEILAREFALARSRGGNLSLTIMDVDHFKQVNDRHSHAAGDQVLRIMADLIRVACGENDTPARYGGEEFVILFQEMDLEAARERCEALRKSIEGHDYSEVADGIHVTISMGVSDRLDLPNHDKLVSDADDKLYRAKSQGRNRVIA